MWWWTATPSGFSRRRPRCGGGSNVRAEDTRLWARVPKTKRGLVVRMQPNVEDEVVERMRADGLIVDAPRVPTEEEWARYYPLIAKAVNPASSHARAAAQAAEGGAQEGGRLTHDQ